MKETGGTLEDYIRLNADYSTVNDESQLLVKEYYKKTKPHLDNEEINFLWKISLAFDEDTG